MSNLIQQSQPPQAAVDQIIGLYNQGQLEQTVSLSESLAKQYPNALILYDILGAAYIGLKNVDKTIESYQKALRLNPNHTDAYNNMGMALYDQGRFDEAVESYQKAVKLEPSFADAHYNLGNALKQTGDLKKAIESYRVSLTINPNDAEVLLNYGNALKNYGDFEQAIEIYAQALKIDPNSAAAQTNMDNTIEEKTEIEKHVADYASIAKLEMGSAEIVSYTGTLLMARGYLDAAIDSYKQATKIKPDFAEAYYNMGNALKDKGELDAAIDSYKQATKIKPDFAEAYYNMGNALKDKGELDAAIDSYKQAIKIKPDSAAAYSNMGVALTNKGDVDEAIDSYKQAIKIKPDYAEAYCNLGNAQKDKNDLEAAIDSYKQAIKIKPNYPEAHLNLSFLKKYESLDEQIIQMKSLHDDHKIESAQRCYLCFALAKASEDLGNFEEAFKHLKEGNAIRKKILSYDIKIDQAFFNTIKKTDLANDQNTLASTNEAVETKPIFILGMPRSGTTLIEQIVSSHSKVTGAGELGFIKKFGFKMVVGAKQINKTNLLRFRQQYLNSVKDLAGGCPFIIDKMPENFKYIGLICRAFPDSKIIHLKRDAAATCWSNFKHYFPAKGLGYCFDLDDVVKYYQMYEGLMRFWNDRYADRIYNLDYEKLTLNQEIETKRLISQLDLDWQEACMSPQENKRIIKTASLQQVRQKVYKDSSQQWRKFEPYLDGAFDGLDG